MYLSLILLQAAAGFFTGSAWFFLSLTVLFLLLEFLAVRPEEKYLEDKFGKTYLEYKNSVRKWI